LEVTVPRESDPQPSLWEALLPGQGNPPDAPQLVGAVERVAQVTGRVAATVVADRGFGTATNDRALAELGVQRVGLQRKGTVSAARAQLERTRAFRRLRNWRVGIEARINHLKRGFGLRRTRLRRLPGAEDRPQRPRAPAPGAQGRGALGLRAS
jgi:IS5 family transposase